MKTLLAALVVGILVLPVGSGAAPREDLGPPGPASPLAGSAGPSWEAPEIVLYDNGPLVNSVGTGPGGADESIARDTTAGLTSRGFNCSLSGGYRVADEFVVGAGGWNIASITFFPYMGSSPPTAPSPISAINLQIWDGSPDLPGSSVVWGDTATNRLANTLFANIYRRKESEPADASRVVFSVVATVGTTLTPGTYWLDWQVDGNATYSGPWAPPITIDGQTTTGNALQWTGSAWQAVIDSGLSTALGMPFIVEGAVVPVELSAFTIE